MTTINVPVKNVTTEIMEQICERFDIKVKKDKEVDYYQLSTKDPINFFWLGINLNRKLAEIDCGKA